MLCGGCGYENPVSLARCPRCGLSEETVVARSLAAASAAVAEAERTDPIAVSPPVESLTLATKVTSPPRHDAPAGAVPLAQIRLRPPLAARPEADWIPVAIVGGAIIAFLVGTMLGVSLLPS